MILEFAALSRLSGESVFEVFHWSQLHNKAHGDNKMSVPHIQILTRWQICKRCYIGHTDVFQENARKALDVLWERRQRGSDLVGTVINIHNEEWVRRGEATWRDISGHEPRWRDLTLYWIVCSDSGVGAGIDSYYEYLMKAYILLGDKVFLDRFNVVSPVSLYWNLHCCPPHRGHILSAWYCTDQHKLYVCDSTTVPLWSTSASLLCCSTYTCTIPPWVFAAGWTLSWRSSQVCRSGKIPHRI